MTKGVVCACFAALLSGACAPLAQAPLIYSSKAQGGIHIATTTTETPGIELSIGFKVIDAAYVPVAVARPCEDRQPASCTDLSYGVQLIAGGNKESNGTAPTADELTRAERIYDDARNERAAANGRFELARKAADDARALKADARTSREAATQALGATPADDALAQQDAKAKADEAAVTYEAAARVAAEAETTRANAEASYTQAANTEAVAKGAVETIRNALIGSSTDDKNDALSVFGSFDGDAGTTTKSNEVTAGLTLGKVFSTGVAAQNLTQGMGDSAALTAASNCLKSGTELIGILPLADRTAKAVS